MMLELIQNARLLSGQRGDMERLEGVQRLRRTNCIPYTQKFEFAACYKSIRVRAMKGVQEPEREALKVDFERLILLLEDAIPPKFAYKTNCFTD